MRAQRPESRGKFLYVGDEKLYVRGVTYGTFRPNADGDPYPSPAKANRDFALMAANGINAVRTYTLPPAWALDAAAEHGLFVLPSLEAERLVGHLNDGRRAQARVGLELQEQVRRCAGHPALLGYSIANEIPASIVRWLGPRRVEEFLRRLCDEVREVDPTALVTYVNYPTTEYLELPFLDLVCFNVFLEQADRLAAYLARLQNLAGERPLLMTELGLDSLRNGEEEQARCAAWQLHTAFGTGCAGTFFFAWTDEWHCQGEEMYDWSFGLTDRNRMAKPALAAAREAYAEVPFPRRSWPRVSVVVCAYNAEPTIRECLDAALRQNYPDFEVIVIDDGSTDATAEFAQGYPVRLIRTENRGLSSARNTGHAVADGDVIAYLDSDAYPDVDWLQYLANVFVTTDVVGVGGPNFPPPGDGSIADCVARAPGGPAHVLLSDTVAEHIPGCNMAFRAHALTEVGGFDPRLRVAGDDVDMCWRLQDHGWQLGFSPAAVVWHHRRNSVRAYWRQQRGYGRAEALLEAKWPEKYNAAGHFGWGGRIYDRGLTRRLVRQQRIYHGTWGMAPFQSLYERAPGTVGSLSLTPEWLLLTGALAGLALLGSVWAPLLVGLPLGVLAGLAAGVVIVQALVNAVRVWPDDVRSSRRTLLGRRLLTACLHVLQPMARLAGRLNGGLTVWRGHRVRGFRLPIRRSGWAWSERWVDPEERLQAIETHLVSSGDVVRRGGNYDRWDLELQRTPLGSARLLLCVEGLGGGAQLTRYRCWPVMRRAAAALVVAFAAVAVLAGMGGAFPLAALAAAVGGILAGLAIAECGAALGTLLDASPASLRVGSSRASGTATLKRASLRARTFRRADSVSSVGESPATGHSEGRRFRR